LPRAASRILRWPKHGCASTPNRIRLQPDFALPVRLTSGFAEDTMAETRRAASLLREKAEGKMPTAVRKMAEETTIK